MVISLNNLAIYQILWVTEIFEI